MIWIKILCRAYHFSQKKCDRCDRDRRRLEGDCAYRPQQVWSPICQVANIRPRKISNNSFIDAGEIVEPLRLNTIIQRTIPCKIINNGIEKLFLSEWIIFVQ